MRLLSSTVFGLSVVLLSTASFAQSRIAVVVLPSRPEVATSSTMTRRMLEDAVRARSGYILADLGAQASPDDTELRVRALAEGKQALLRAAQYADEYQLEAAQEQATLAIARLEESDLERGIDSLLEALTVSALVSERQGRVFEAKNTLVRAFTLRPSFTVASNKLTPQFSKIVDDARSKVASRERATASIRTSPPGAAAFIDGVFVGVTPVEVTGLAVGVHGVTVKLPGYSISQDWLSVEPKFKVSLPLQVASRGDALLGRLAQLNNSFASEADRTRNAAGLAEWGALDELVLARVDEAGGRIQIRAFRTNDSGRTLARSEQVLTEATLGTTAGGLAALEKELLGSDSEAFSVRGRADESIRDDGPGLTSRQHLAIASAGAGGVLAIGGIVLGLKADSQSKDAQALFGTAAHEAAASKAKKTALIADLCYIGAAAGLATGAVLWFTGQNEPPRSSVSVSFFGSPEGAAASVRGSF